MKKLFFRLLILASIAACCISCSSVTAGGSFTKEPAPGSLRNPVLPMGDAAAAVRTGDNLRVQLQGIPDAAEFTVQVDDQGYVNLRFVGRINAVGRAPSELAKDIEQAYIDGNFYKSINVSVGLSERFIYVGGEVQRPGRVLWTPDLTLSSAITAAGGFTPYARESAVTLSRDNKSYTMDARLAARVPAEDRPLLPGDRINVAKSAF